MGGGNLLGALEGRVSKFRRETRGGTGRWMEIDGTASELVRLQAASGQVWYG